MYVEPIIYPLQAQQQELRQQALTFQSLINNQQYDKQVYLISLDWLNRWKIYVSYEEFINNQPPSKYLAGPKLGKINEDLIDTNVKTLFKYFPILTHKWNYFLKENLQLNQDFLLLDQQTWTFFRNSGYEAIQLVRTQQGEDLEINLKKINVALICQTMAKNIQNGRLSKVFYGLLQVSKFSSLTEWIEQMEKTMKTFKQYQFETNQVKLWKTNLSQEELFDQIKNQMQPNSLQIDLLLVQIRKIHFKLNQSQYETISQYQIQDRDLIIIDAKEKLNDYLITDKIIPKGRCEWCKNQAALKMCECGEVGYCKESCQLNDEIFHAKQCPQALMKAQSKLLQMERQPNSADGKCGLHNIGNTCFMNSGLQCLSNTTQLSEYFLSNLFQEDINLTNPLGTQGQLANSFALLLKTLWYKQETSFTPFQFKKTLAHFQQMFSGYQQHDSQEFIMYLLDGLHEDLNVVKNKPFVEQTESNGRDDLVVATEHWDCHLMRNQSIIVSLFQAQFKNRTECPKCKHVSISFDPYMMIPLPLQPYQAHSNGESNQQICYYLLQNNLAQAMKPCYHKIPSNQDYRVVDLQDDLQALYGPVLFNLSSVSYIDVCNNLFNKIFDQVIQDEEIQSFVQKLGNLKLLVRPLTNYELEQSDKIEILIRHQYLEGTFQRDIAEPRTMIFGENTNLKEIHQILFKTYKQLIGYNEDSSQYNYEQSIMNNLYTVLIKTNVVQGIQNSCYFCSQYDCNNCWLPYTDKCQLKELKNKISQSDFGLEFKIIWNHCGSQGIPIKDLFESYNQQQFQDLNGFEQPMQQQQESVNLKQCFSYFQECQTLDENNKWFCKWCKDFVNARKKIQIYSTPLYLILHLKRFKDDNAYFKEKLDIFVDYPLELDINQFIGNNNLPSQYLEGDEQKNVKYHLYGIVNHYGGLDCGHYTATVRNKYDKKWYLYEDSVVSETEEIITKHAYILFYERKES